MMLRGTVLLLFVVVGNCLLVNPRDPKPQCYGLALANVANPEKPMVYTAKLPTSLQSAPLLRIQPGDGHWWSFEFGETGSAASRTFVFESAVTTKVLVTDVFCAGDAFMLANNNVELGSTLTVPTSCYTNTPDPSVAANNIGWSHGEFFLSPGQHSISIWAIRSPFGAGTGAIKVEIAQQ